MDAHSRISPAIDVRLSYRDADVVETLERVTTCYGLPRQIRLDNGPEIICRDLDLWVYAPGVVLDFSRPGKPTDNAFAESFNGKVRAECLNANWFLSLEDARRKCEAWRWTTTRSGHTARSATEPRSSWPTPQDRVLRPEASKPEFCCSGWSNIGGKSKEAGFSRSGWSKTRGKSKGIAPGHAVR
ncbi:hypothetical protein GCM10011504_58550 [Siccirubricoccus deserti]|nr:hypothetical protein GCM10011504_58550 [Siccirubricoccus deserti]